MVYVDGMTAAFGRMIMCHMMADTTEELLAMADKIGVQRKWIQYPNTPKEHFDICLSKKKKAIQHGAIELGWREMAQFMQSKKTNQNTVIDNKTNQMSLKGMTYQFMSGVKDPDVAWGKLLPPMTEDINEHHLNEFFRTMYERQQIWYKRTILKQPAPWTEDKYLRDYKFTNVYRELDRASQWLIKNVLLDHSLSLEDLLFRIIIFRFYNQPDTFDTDSVYFVKLPHYESYCAKKLWLETVMYRKKVANPWHTAYMMNIAFLKMPKDWDAEKKGMFKDHAYCEHAFPKIHAMIPTIVEALKICETPEGIMHVLEKLPATAGFQAHEFYIDLCYCAKYWKEPVMKFDQDSFTNVGPGCSLGLRLIFPSLKPSEQIEGIYWLRDLAENQLSNFDEDFKYVEWDRVKKQYVRCECNITLHQIEMFLCEYQKYWKMTIQQGKQRSKFVAKTK